jgi:hypothetical protein
MTVYGIPAGMLLRLERSRLVLEKFDGSRE